MITRRAFLTGLTATTALVAVPGAALATIPLPEINVSSIMWDVDFDPNEKMETPTATQEATVKNAVRAAYRDMVNLDANTAVS